MASNEGQIKVKFVQELLLVLYRAVKVSPKPPVCKLIL